MARVQPLEANVDVPRENVQKDLSLRFDMCKRFTIP